MLFPDIGPHYFSLDRNSQGLAANEEDIFTDEYIMENYSTPGEYQIIETTEHDDGPEERKLVRTFILTCHRGD